MIKAFVLCDLSIVKPSEAQIYNKELKQSRNLSLVSIYLLKNEFNSCDINVGLVVVSIDARIFRIEGGRVTQKNNKN